MLDQREYELLQRIELEILCAFDAFCREHGLVYYLIGGALLGAVRYGGFIPWDDDVDVAMPREDYERLQQLWINEPRGTYFLQSGKNDPKFSRCILKLRKNNTRIVEEISRGIDMHEGIYIDIFPIDYLDSPPGRKVALRAGFIHRLMSMRAIKNGYTNGRYSTIKRCLMVLLKPISNRWMDRMIERLCTKENSGNRNYATLLLHNYSWDRQTHEACVLGRGGICNFEGREFMAPSDAQRFLTRVFGADFMMEPPKEKQKPPHRYLSVEF